MVTYLKRMCLVVVALCMTGYGYSTVIISKTFRSQTFTTNGTWRVPAGVTSVKVIAWGGGGGGGGSCVAGGTGGGGGGGAGCVVEKTISVTPNTDVSVVIGLGGQGGSGGLQGAAGGATFFGPAPAPLVYAAGGWYGMPGCIFIGGNSGSGGQAGGCIYYTPPSAATLTIIGLSGSNGGGGAPGYDNSVYHTSPSGTTDSSSCGGNGVSHNYPGGLGGRCNYKFSSNRMVYLKAGGGGGGEGGYKGAGGSGGSESGGGSAQANSGAGGGGGSNAVRMTYDSYSTTTNSGGYGGSGGLIVEWWE